MVMPAQPHAGVELSDLKIWKWIFQSSGTLQIHCGTSWIHCVAVNNFKLDAQWIDVIPVGLLTVEQN